MTDKTLREALEGLVAACCKDHRQKVFSLNAAGEFVPPSAVLDKARAALADSADAPEGPRMPMVECRWCGAEHHWRLWHDCPKRPSMNRLDAQQEEG